MTTTSVIDSPGMTTAEKVTRLLFVSTCPARNYSGGRYHAFMLAEAAAARGHEVTYWCTARPVFYDDLAVCTGHRRVELKISPDFSAEPDGPFDVVVIIPDMSSWFGMYERALCIAARDKGRTVLVNFETPNWFNAMAPVSRSSEKWTHWATASRYCDMILSLTREGTRYAEAFYRDAPAHTLFRHSYPAINSLCADRVAPEQRIDQIICITRVGDDHAHKGQLDLAALFVPEIKGFTVALVLGTGNLDETRLESVKAAAARVGAHLKVLHAISDEEKFREIRRSRFMVFLSHFEGYGYPPMEAQYCGIPCIAYDLPVLRETSADHLTYVPIGDIATLKHEVARLANGGAHGAWLDEARENARRVAGFEAVSEHLEELLGELEQLQAPPAAQGFRPQIARVQPNPATGPAARKGGIARLREIIGSLASRAEAFVFARLFIFQTRVFRRLIESVRQRERLEAAFTESPQALSSLLADLLKTVTTAQVVREAIVKNDTFASSLAAPLLNRPPTAAALRKQILEHERFTAGLIAGLLDHPVVADVLRKRIVAHEAFSSSLMTTFLNQPAAAEALREQITQHRGFLHLLVAALLDDPTSVSILRNHIAENEEFLSGLVAVLASRPVSAGILRSRIVDRTEFSSALIDEILNRPILANILRGKIVSDQSFVPRLLSDLFHHDESAAVIKQTVRQDTRLAQRIVSDVAVAALATQTDRAHQIAVRTSARIEFCRILGALERYIDEAAQARIQASLTDVLSELSAPQEVWPRLVDLLCDGDRLCLRPKPFRFLKREDLRILITEILLNEEYYFEAGTPSPTIIDAGCNFGLATYYFKHLYPQAKIIAFEPSPACVEILRENVATYGWTDVTIHPCALATKKGTTTFYAPVDSPMGGSLSRRLKTRGFEVSEVEVETRRLSPFLDQPIDLLKLDVEGAEDVVLRECKGALHRVSNLFCEFHYGEDLPRQRLADILNLLEQSGFDVRIDQSFSGRARGLPRPFDAVRAGTSLILWARRRDAGIIPAEVFVNNG